MKFVLNFYIAYLQEKNPAFKLKDKTTKCTTLIEEISNQINTFETLYAE